MNNLNNLNYEKTINNLTKSENQKLLNRDVQHNPNKNYHTETVDNELNDKVNRLIYDIKKDTSRKKIIPISSSSNNLNTDPDSETIKKKLYFSKEVLPFSNKIEDYFTKVVENIEKNSEVIKGVSSKIMNLEPKTAIVKDLKTDYLNETQIKSKQNQQLPKNIYEAINNKITEGTLNILCNSEIKEDKKKHVKNAYLDKLNSSISPAKKNFYLESIERLNSSFGSFENERNTRNTRNAYNPLKVSLIASIKKGGGYPHDNKEIPAKDQFYDWNYNSILSKC